MPLSEFFPMWDALTSAQQMQLSTHLMHRRESKGTVLHNGSLDCAGLLLVQSGQLRAYILSEEGREITVYRLFEGDICIFSAACVLRSVQFEIIIEAEKDTTMLQIPPQVFKGILETSAPLANYVNEIMASHFSEVMWLLEAILWKSFDRRLASFLLEESVIEGSDALKLTHEAIGNHMGNPREVVTRMLKYFQNEGMVRLSRGCVELLDRQRLEVVAGR